MYELSAGSQVGRRAAGAEQGSVLWEMLHARDAGWDVAAPL